eukprot:scaffold174869_cov21-Tisochrysis_lutea.AAC.5
MRRQCQTLAVLPQYMLAIMHADCCPTTLPTRDVIPNYGEGGALAQRAVSLLWCFRSAALAGGYSDVTLPSVQTRNEKKKTMRKRQEGQRQQWTD